MARSGDEYARQVADALIAQIQAGTAPWMKPWVPGAPIGFPHNPTTGKPYRGGNALWLMAVAEACGYADARWMTYKQAASIGAQVRQGEKGTRVQYWLWEGDEPVRDASGRELRGDDGKLLTVRVRYERPRVFTATVFNASQMDGLEAEVPRNEIPEWERHDRAEALVRATGAQVRHLAGDRAYYDILEDVITLPEPSQFTTADRYYGTKLHELGHWTAHPSRMARDVGGPLSAERAREELRAEIASFMLGGELGIGHDPSRHAAYVEGWVKALRDDPREIFRAASDAEKIRTFVLGFERALEERELDGRDRAAPPPVLADAPVVAAVKEGEVEGTDEKGRRYLHVPFVERNHAKKVAKDAGVWIRFDPKKRAWYMPANVDPSPFLRWLEGPVRVAPDPVTEFGEALVAAGLRLEGPPAMDGALHRVPVEGDKPGERSGAYKGYLDGHPAGYIENFKSGFKNARWKSSMPVATLSAGERARLMADAEAKRAMRAQARDEAYRVAAAAAADRWQRAAPLGVGATHPYLDGKGVPPMGELRVDREDGALLVPVRDAEGRLQSLEAISPRGRKSFHKDGRLAGGMFTIPALEAQPSGAETIFIAEGYATGATVARATGSKVVVAFTAGNLELVALAVRAASPAAAVCIAADNDEATVAKKRALGQAWTNVGIDKARKAAAAVGGFVLAPKLAGIPGSDWNDLEQAVGREEVRARLLAGLDEARRGGRSCDLAAPAGAGRREEARRERELERSL